MQIILLDKVVNLGNLGDIVKVKDGYARNFLIPQRMAKRATPAAMAEFEARRAELEKAAAEKLAAAQGVADKMADLSVSVARKAGMDGRLFGSVGNADIADALKAAGFEIDKAAIRMPDGPLKAIGENRHVVGESDKWIGAQRWTHAFLFRDANDNGVVEPGEMVIVGPEGLNVYPADVEAVLARDPAVKDAVVLGRPTDRGEVVHADVRAGQVVATVCI